MTKQVNKTSIEVKNFGPIIDATVELRPLTVFVGPSNTGKSYLSILIYALHKVFGRGPRSLGRYIFYQSNHSMRGNEVEEIIKFAKSFDSDFNFSRQNAITIPFSIVSILQSQLNGLEHVMSDEIIRCFGINNIQDLIRQGQKSSQFILRNHFTQSANYSEHNITLRENPKICVKIPTQLQIPISNKEADSRMPHFLRDFRKNEFEEEEKSSPAQRWIAIDTLSSIYDAVLPSLVGHMHLPAYYLPADRTGIMHAHNVVVSALIANAPTAGLRRANQTPTLSGVLADFLEQLIYIDELRDYPSKRKSGSSISAAIENSILGGSVNIDRSGITGYPKFAYQPNGWKRDISVAHASSMVAELTPLVLYLRHMITSDNVLIVEEPESHLHPAMQVALMQQLAALVKAGIRVIVTTHSEWLLEELANIVQRSNLPEFAQGDKIALHSNEVGAWLFEPQQKSEGSVVKEINLQETGLYPSGFDEVSSALHNEWCDISEYIEENS